jgi:8-amino-7-oxononanoate synthase
VQDDLDRWHERWAGQGNLLREQGRFRTLGRGGDARFCHNDYLGLRRDPRILEIAVRALRDGLPTTSSGSRLLSGNLPAFEEFESAFAQAAGLPSALLFGSASEANRVAISALVGRHDVVLHDALAHASLIDGIHGSGARRVKFAHNDLADLRAQLSGIENECVRLVVTESVFSMDGDVAPLESILTLCEEFGALLLVDEAHAVGLAGPQKTGHCEMLPRRRALVATTHGFGKALASSGAILCTLPEVVDRIVNTSRAFIFTTAPSPVAMAIARATWELSRTESSLHTRLLDRCEQMHRGLHRLGWSSSKDPSTPIFPLLCGGLERARLLAQRFESHGIPLRPIRPPTVPFGAERLRATLSADLERSDVEAFLEILKDA